MKNFGFLIAFAALAFGLGGCKKDGSLDLVFEARMNGQAVAAGQKFSFAGGPAQLNFSKVAGFFTVVSLTKTDGSEVVLNEYDHLDLTDGAQSIRLGSLDPAAFSSVKIGFGLPASLNSTNPSGLKSSDPRTANGRDEWWGGWKSYIFSKIEGRFDREGDGTLETGLSYHCGSDAVYREIVFDKAFSIEKGETSELRLVWELSDFLKEGGQPLDIAQKPKTSDDADDVSVATILVNNLPQAVKIQ